MIEEPYAGRMREVIEFILENKPKKGTRNLRKTYCGQTLYCIEGIMCEVANRNGIGRWEGRRFSVDGSDTESAVAPDEVLSWLGLRGRFFPDPVGKTGYKEFWKVNDRTGYSLKSLALELEKQFLS